jgi:hypothetical protein
VKVRVLGRKGITIRLTAEGKEDSRVLLRMIEEMAKPSPAAARSLPKWKRDAATPTKERP